MQTNDKSTHRDRIKFLQEFADILRRYHNDEDNEAERLKTEVNKNVVAARSLVIDSGAFRTLTLAPPAAIGGPIAQSIDPFDMLFIDWYGDSLVPHVITMVEQAIGVYEQLDKGTDFIRMNEPETIDIESAIERSLRPMFRSTPPTSEREVQDAIENILNVLGIDFIREKESTTVGPRSFKPDFTVATLSLAIEAKLASSKHSASDIQEEIAADVSAYKTKWKRLLIIIYDNGVIADPHKLRQDNMKHFGVSVVVVKH